MGSRFVAVDVETANPSLASICSIGVAVFEGEEVVSEWYSLINPQDYFSGIHSAIHGIHESDVLTAPSFREATANLSRLLADEVVVTHTHCDRVAIHQASVRAQIDAPRCAWLDSARVVRRTWPEYAVSGYGLANLCKRIGYTFHHHNALEDAKAAGRVLLASMRESGLDLDATLKRERQPLTPKTAERVKRQGNSDGILAGEVIVFTGALRIPRSEAADLAASAGCEVAAGVNKKTTMLVVGDQDVRLLNGHEKSSKHRKAELMIASGAPLRILRETDFKALVTFAEQS